MKSFDKQHRPRHAPLICLAVAFSFVGAIPCAAQLGTGLVPRYLALRHGLERSWFARAEVDPSRTGDLKCILDGDDLILLTTAGLVQVIDANTGQTRWVTHIGNPDYPNLGPAASKDLIAAMNGSQLYLLGRETGRVVSRRTVPGIPGGGPALGERYVFTPQMLGRMEGFPLDGPEHQTWFYQSFGRLRSAPRVTPESLVWGTDAGMLYVARLDPLRIHFRIEAAGEFEASPAYRSPLIFAVTVDGDCFAVNEQEGQLRWKYTTGFPVERAPAVVGDRVYLSSVEPMLHCVNASTGLLEWEAPGISQFAAATKTHVFGVDRFGTIHVLDWKSGAPLGSIASGGTLRAIVNDQTDRLFLVSNSGLIQCLHEVGAKETTYYHDQPKAEEEKPAVETTEGEEYRGDGQPAGTESETATEEDPFAETTAEEDPFSTPVDGSAAPFGVPAAEETAPAADAGAGDENPFE